MDQLLIGNFPQGIRSDREPFVIDNSAFPVLENACVWRGRILKKGGTDLLGRLRRDLANRALGNTDGGGAFSGNLVSIFSLQANSSIVPGTIEVTVGAQVFTDNSSGVLSNGGGGTGTVNYATGAIAFQTAPVLAATAATIDFSYYPRLPVMGLEDFETNEIEYPTLLAFDTVYSYQFNQSTNSFYSTSFYKSGQPVVWTGQNWQQFWTCNYQGALWAVNNNPGFHFKAVSTWVAGTPTTVNTATNHNLVNGDYVWFNEVQGASAAALNGLTFQVTVTSPTQFTVPAVTAGLTNGTGIFQTLTASSAASGDGIRWYDGDYTTDPTKGWVNFAPPLSPFNASTNPNPFYLVGALAVLPFKGRLLFFAPTFSTSNGVTSYFQDRVVFSWNGTAYYSSLVPSGQTSSAQSWYFPPDSSAGYIGAGISQQIVTIANNEDVLLIGFEGRQTRFVYTENDLTPFLFYSINSQLGSEGTFSSVTLDKGAITVGTYGIIQSSQYGVERIDLQIPDEVFRISGANHGVERICSIRDYYNELIYFTYPVEGQNAGNDDTENPNFPNHTLVYNYRDNTWGIYVENYTTYGTFRRNTALRWDDVTWTWDEWTMPWDYGQAAPRFPNIIGGNQQGYVLIKYLQRDKAGEDISGYLTNVAGTTITSPNHNLETGDYLYFSGSIGISNLNGTLRQVLNVVDVNTFTIKSYPPSAIDPTGTYLGGGEFIRLSNFQVSTKQFPVYWQEGRQVRIGNQRYLFDRTNGGQVTVGISVSQDELNAADFSSNSGLIFNNIIFTSADPNTAVSSSQQQIWHNFQTSLIGDTIQVIFYLNDSQMRNLEIAQSPVTLQAIQIDTYPAGILAGPLII